jgi:hypothetical protein
VRYDAIFRGWCVVYAGDVSGINILSDVPTIPDQTLKMKYKVPVG